MRSLDCWECRFESHQGMDVCVFCECCVLSGKGLCDGSIPSPAESYWVCVCVCVCVSLSVIRCNNNPLHLRRISRKVRLSKKRKKKTKERKKEGKKERKKCFVSFCFACLPGSHFRDCKQRSAIPCWLGGGINRLIYYAVRTSDRAALRT